MAIKLRRIKRAGKIKKISVLKKTKKVLRKKFLRLKKGKLPVGKKALKARKKRRSGVKRKFKLKLKERKALRRRGKMRIRLRKRRKKVPKLHFEPIDFVGMLPDLANAVIKQPNYRTTRRAYDNIVSIIIPSFEQPELVEKCVESIRSTAASIPHEIIVVDDASSLNVQNHLRSWAPSDVKLILNGENVGFSRTVNAGVRAARGKFVLFVNSDIIFHEQGWLEKMLNALQASDNIGIVGARLLYADGTIQHGGAFPAKNGSFDHRYRFMHGDFFPALAVEDVHSVTGALMLIKQELLEEIGPFSEEYFIAFEDMDLCYRAKKHGWRVVYCGMASAIHLEGKSRGVDERTKSPFLIQKEKEAMETFWKKWGGISINPFKNMEVIYVLESTGVAGGIKNVLDHVNQLHVQGYNIQLFSLTGQPDWYHLAVPVRKFPNYESMAHELMKRDALKVATWWKTLPVVLYSCDIRKGGRGVPFYLVQDIEESYYPNDEANQRAVLQTYQTPVHIMTIADWTTEQLRNRFNKYASNISIAINLDLFKPNRTHNYDPYRILCCSRKSQHLKGFEVTEQAVDEVYRRFPRASAVTFGLEEPPFKEIPRLHFPRPSDQIVADLYANCGVFVQTSHHEGFGMPILEAMACGAPVVTTKAEGNEEFCKDGFNCVMVEKGDVEGVVQGIIKIMSDRQFTEQISENAKRTALRYYWPNIVFKLNNVFGNFR